MIFWQAIVLEVDYFPSAQDSTKKNKSRLLRVKNSRKHTVGFTNAALTQVREKKKIQLSSYQNRDQRHGGQQGMKPPRRRPNWS